MLFVFDEDGTPSVASMLDIDPEVPMDSRTPQVVDQFEYPRLPTEWSSAQPADDPSTWRRATAGWPPGPSTAPVQLVRGAAGSNGGLGLVGYHLALGASGSLERTLEGLDPGREYRISLRYARDSRVAGDAGDAALDLDIGDLDTTITATTSGNPSQSGQAITFGTYVGTFTAFRRVRQTSAWRRHQGHQQAW